MNSYNDNLHSVVVATLQAQELENKQLNSQRIASMFTLYHAEGATITAFEKLRADQKTLKAKSDVQTQAVDNSNISTNLLASATQAASYVAQSVTNTSVAAANMQVAGNAILKLAGDMGNVYSILNAADFDTEIYNQGKTAKDLINDTAYLAEVATQTAMEASIKTSEVSMPTVLNKAKATNTLMNNLLQITTADFNNVSQLVANDNATVASTSVTEKAAEGNYEDIVADYKAARSVYSSANGLLNLGLVIAPPLLRDTSFPPLNSDFSTRNIQFDLITSPFAIPMDPKISVQAGVKLSPDANPVSDYYIILVKEENKTTFSITDAESIIMKGGPSFIQVHVTPSHLDIKNGTEQVFTPAVLTRVDNKETVLVISGRANMNVDFFDVDKGKKLMDSDGDKIKPGTNYVIFLMAVYDKNYKKKLNNFDDYLSATSNTFKLAYLLQPAMSVEAGPVAETDPEESWYEMKAYGQQQEFGSEPVPPTHEIRFSVSENPVYAGDVEYRCVIVPGKDEVMPGMLTRSGLLDLEKEVDLLEQITDKYDLVIADTHNKLLTTQQNFERMGFVPTCQSTNPPTTSAQQNEYNKEFNALKNALLKAKDPLEVQALMLGIDVKLRQFKEIGFTPSYQTTNPASSSEQQAEWNNAYNTLQVQLEKESDPKLSAKLEKEIQEMLNVFKHRGFTPSYQSTTPPTKVKQQAEYNSAYNALNDEYVTALNAKAKALAQIQHHTADNFSFFFNLKLAEQVSPDNYILPAEYTVRNASGFHWPVIDFKAPFFGPATTDNFGNLLIPGKKYTVVVLSISMAEEQNLSQFINNWTGNSTPIATFTYTENVPAAKLEDSNNNGTKNKKSNPRKK